MLTDCEFVDLKRWVLGRERFGATRFDQHMFQAKSKLFLIPIGSMYGMFPYIYYKKQLNAAYMDPMGY